MGVSYLSASAIKDFLLCHLKFLYRSDRSARSVKGDHAKLGSAVHEAIEQFTRRMIAKQSFPDASDYDFAVATFMNNATEAGLEDMTFFKEGRQIVVSYIDGYDPSEKVLEDGIEHFFRLTSPAGVPIVGAIDKVVELSPDTIGIYDYKTARNALTNNELLTDVQLSMYDLAGSIVWPQYPNRVLFLDYVRIGKKVSTYRTDEDRKSFNEFLSATWTQVNKLEESEATGTLNRLCGWCDYKDRCPAYQNFLSAREPGFKTISEMSDEEVLTHWTEIADKKSIIESRQRELKMMVNERFMMGREIAAGGQELQSMQSSRTNFDIEDVITIIPHTDVFNVLTVNKSRLDKYVKEHPEYKAAIGRVGKVSYTAASYVVRKSAIEEEIPLDDAEQDEEAA